MNYSVKDARGMTIVTRKSFPNYAKVVREMLDAKAVLPLTVWAYNPILCIENYDGERTRRLSDSIVAHRKAMRREV